MSVRPLLATLALAPAVLVACSASGPVPTSTAPSTTGSTSPAASASTPEPPENASTADIRDVWRARCGNCHTRVEPGSRTHEAIVAAMERHHKRVRLSDSQWSKMVDFLAPAPQAAP
jgi:cytochrome c5